VTVLRDDNPSAPTVFNVIGECDVGTLTLWDDSIGNISAGSFGHISAARESVLSLSGGHIRQGVDAHAFFTGVIDVSGGVIGDHLSIANTGVLNLSGGHIMGDLVTFAPFGGGVSNISGGLIEGDLVAQTDAVFHISGGSLGGRIEAHDDSIVNLYGYDLQLDDELLTGTLADGNPLRNEALAFDSGRFILHQIPEPGGLLALFSAALMGLLIVRRARGSPNRR
jgi:hypothetical protein